MNHIEQLKDLFFIFLAKTFNLSPEKTASITFTINSDPEKKDFGDISSNAAMIIAKEVKNNPRTIAQQIIDSFHYPDLESIQIAGPGFLNFFLKPDFFQKTAHQLFKEGKEFFKLDTTSPKEHFSIEFVSANPTGPLHLGHGRGGIIGDVLGAILQFLGHAVTKEFYINDAGAQIDKLGTSLKIRCQQLLGYDAPLPEDAYHGEYLKDLAQKFIEQFSENVLSQPDSIFAHYAQNHLLTEIKKTLANYGILFDVWFSEKTLHDNDHVAQALETLKNGNFTYTQENAVWFKSTEFGDDKDRVLKRANGQYTYIAADVAYLQNKLNRGFSKIIMILGQDHHSYGTRMRAIMQALGNSPENLQVILYQLVSIKEGGHQVRMSKRAGTIVDLAEVIETVGKDVARFFYLHRKADAHLDFDLELALKQTEENPVFYIQYAYVRTCSILEKAALHKELHDITENDLTELSDDEILLMKKITELKELLVSISKNHQTHLLSYYVIELAHAFHRYYSKNRVINLESIQVSRSRLASIMILRKSFGLCLELLGLNAPEKM
jgi:arginyl-tRNA synthetase